MIFEGLFNVYGKGQLNSGNAEVSLSKNIKTISVKIRYIT